MRGLLVQIFGEYRLPLLSIAGVLLVLAFGLWPMKSFPWAMYGLLIFSPFVLVTTGEACWRAIRYDPTPFLDKATIRPLLSDPSAPRVVWLILDEMDQRSSLKTGPRASSCRRSTAFAAFLCMRRAPILLADQLQILFPA